MEGDVRGGRSETLYLLKAAKHLPFRLEGGKTN